MDRTDAMAMESSSSNHWIRQISKRRQTWVGKCILWVVAVVGAVLSVMLLTAPKDISKHNRAVAEDVERRVYPAVKSELRQKRMESVQSQPEGDRAVSQAVWSLVEAMLGSGMGSEVATGVMADELAIDEVKNRHIFTVGLHGGETLTVGMFGHVWTVFDFMTDRSIAREMKKRLNFGEE